MVFKSQGEITTAKEVADRYEIPFDVMAKVMQTLAQRGVLKSEQGALGGYLVQKDLSKVTFFDFAEMIEGPIGLVRCVHKKNDSNCERIGSCNILSPITYLNERIKDLYKNLTLSELLKQGRRSDGVST